MGSRTPARPAVVQALNSLGTWRALVVLTTLVLGAGWLAIGVTYGIVPVKPPLTNRLGGNAAGDLMFFYSAARLSAGGRAAEVYDAAALTAEGHAALGSVPELVWPYPPTIAAFLAPLGWLPPSGALAVWILVLAGSLVVLGRALAGLPGAAAVLLFPASGLALFAGQISPVLALCLGVLVLSSGHRPVPAGIALGLLAWKPHFAIVPAIACLLRRDWRTLAAGAASLGVVIVLSLVLYGTEAWQAFFERGLRHAGAIDIEAPMARFVTVYGSAATHGLPALPALVVHGLFAAIGCTAGLWLWVRSARMSTRALGLAGASFAATPYALDYDLVLFAVPWLLMIREATAGAAPAAGLLGAWVALAMVAPVSYMLSIYTGRAYAGPTLVLLVTAVWAAERHTRPRTPEP